MTIRILAAKATEPDSDGDSRFEVSFSFTNESCSTVELLQVRLLVCAPDGTPLGEAEEEIEEMISQGESGRMSVSSYRIPYPLQTVTDAKLTLTVVPLSCIFIDAGRLSVPSQPGGISCSTEPISSAGLCFQRWSCHRRRDDRDGEVSIEACAWLENNTTKTIHKPVIRLQLFNYSGRPLNDAESRDDRLLFSDIPAVLTESLYCKKSQLRDSYICATVRGFLLMNPESVNIAELQLDR